MSEKLIAFYNDLYSQNQNPFGKQASEIVPLILKYKSSGSMLDCGAGDGRNSLFLAEHGFNVEAIDFSSVACEQTLHVAREKNLSLQVRIADVNTLEIAHVYDVVLCAFILQHLKRDEAVSFIKKIKSHTASHGINVIGAQTMNGDFFRRFPETENFFDTLNDIKKMYRDWEILEYYKKTLTAFVKKSDGTPAQNECVFLIARKKT